MKLAIIVVLYNKAIKNSTTIKSLSNLKNDDFSVLLFNNGPSLINPDEEDRALIEKFLNIKIVQDIDNRPLSIIYNEFIENVKADSYLILDDDSYVKPSLILKYLSADLSLDLHVPIIRSKSNGEICYPLYDNEIVKSSTVLDFDDSFRTIGSGILMSKCLIDKFRFFDGEIFDTRFSLYGVDFSLFRRMTLLLHKHVEFKISVVGELEHSLSKVDETGDLMENDERYIAMFLGQLLYEKNGIKKERFVLGELLKYLRKMEFRRCMLILNLFLLREHKRSLKYKKNIK
ncbi:conserved hypothetical protein [Alteromonas macleodii]|uniref:glycosyltransferase family 2 protein n=1 Tax=Alteromonas sp. BZK5 TaxID=1904459 RepID=UPI0016538180|nr:hypothetical protein [Alteromonas sp. BZK5]MBC6985300.1 hypothetical protein [Alteromonas sp. BZK5]